MELRVNLNGKTRKDPVAVIAELIRVGGLGNATVAAESDGIGT